MTAAIARSAAHVAVWLLLTGGSLEAAAQAAQAAPAPSRLEQLVEANVLGTHAFQVGLARKAGKGDPACWSPRALDDAQLAARRGAPGRAPEAATCRRCRPGRRGEPSASTRRPTSSRCSRPARARRRAARERLHALARREATHARAPTGPRDREPLPDEPRGRARRRPAAGAVRLLRRPRPAGVPRPARPARARTPIPRHGPRARGQVLRVARRHDRGRVADRRAQELELGREEPRHPRRQGAGGRAAEGAGRRAARPAHEGAAEAADRGRRPLVHDAAPLVDAWRVRADRHRHVRAREPGRRVPPVPGRRPHVDAGDRTASTTT